MKINQDVLLEISKQAKLVLQGEEMINLKHDIERILTWLEPIKKMPLDLNTKFCHYGLSKAKLRIDKVINRKQNLVDLSSCKNNNLVIVPSVINIK